MSSLFRNMASERNLTALDVFSEPDFPHSDRSTHPAGRGWSAHLVHCRRSTKRRMTDQPIATYDPAWMLVYDTWEPKHQPLREALCTLGNGRFATRGAAEEAQAGAEHYPGTYLAGGFNRLESEVSGRIIENEDLVNWPNWLCLSFRPEGDPWFHIGTADLLEFRQVLDIRRGVLERCLRVRHSGNRETTLSSRRIVHMDQPHLAAIQWVLRPENWSGQMEIRSALDGAVTNQGVKRYRELSSRHLEPLGAGRVGEDGIFLRVRTNQSHIEMVQGARTRLFGGDEPAQLERETLEGHGMIEQRLRVQCEQEKDLTVEKTVAVFTSRDSAISEPSLSARGALRRAGRFEELCDSHFRAWRHLWNRADIGIEGDHESSQRILRLHIFHLLQTTSFNTTHLDAGVPARGLHGEAYRGHIFWDELFIFPLLNLRIPKLTRSLLMYRRRRIREARKLAKESGLRGAMFPWQSGSTGREESQALHLNPKSGDWIPDDTYRQRHVNAAIAYNIWEYFRATRDMEFLSYPGAGMLIEIARFWASLTHYNKRSDRYEIHGVVGPDEFHTKYPDAEEIGLKNNAYTNIMAVWVLDRARRMLDLLAEGRRAEIIEKLDLSDDELLRWEEISHRMFVPFHDNESIISQFEGYEELEEFDWAGYERKYGDIQRLDRILDAEGDTPNRYKASKQADVLMLFYLLSATELEQIFHRLDYPFDHETIPRNIDYYLKRTSHGSTLSRIVHSWVLARSDRERSWQLFKQALRSDVEDIQGGTTAEGIHLGAMAGTVDLVQRAFSGLEMREETLWLAPCLPKELKAVRLRIHYRGHWINLRIEQHSVTVGFEKGWAEPAKIGIRDKVYAFAPGDERTFEL